MLATSALALVENGTPKRPRDLFKLPAKLDNRWQDGLGKKSLQNRILSFSRHDSQQLGVAQLNTPLRQGLSDFFRAVHQRKPLVER